MNMDKEKILLLKEEYEKGSSVKTLAKKYKIKIFFVYRCLHEANAKMRDGRFKKGSNTWDLLSPKQKEIRKRQHSKRMSKYNPMFNEDVQKKRSESEKQRRGKTGRLTHREKRRIIQKRGKCERCHIKYPLTVHHKDGDRYNNKLNNLQVLCFNCHYDIEFSNAKYGQKRWKK